MGCNGSSANKGGEQPTPKPTRENNEPESKPKASEKPETKKEKEKEKSKKDDLQMNSRPSGAAFDRSVIVNDNPGKIHEFYDLEKKKLGEGSYGSVSKGKNKSTGAIRAVKTIAKAKMKNVERFKMEIAIMKMMDHPNIIKLYETFDDFKNIYLVMELCTGGELFDRIIDAGHFTEVQAAIVMRDIIRAIYYMHEIHVCHRDLKPENFLFTSEAKIGNDKCLLKIIDFGLSCKFNEDQVLTTKAGTPYYVAPQVLAGKYDHMADLWSCGVIMYVLLCGYPPFYGDNDQEVLNKVKLGNIQFNKADWSNISEDAKTLIKQLLTMNPKQRCTAESALGNIWIKNKAPAAKPVNLQESFVDNLRGFRGQNKLKKAALHVIAGQLDESHIRDLREKFMALDSNGDGLLTVNEMKEGLTKAGLKKIPDDLKQIMEDVDSDGSGVIDYTEFLAATLDKRYHIEEEVCWSAFRVFDKNGDGFISRKELETVLGDGNVQEVGGKDTIAELLKGIDGNGDGKIDFQEFYTMMGGTKTKRPKSG